MEALAAYADSDEEVPETSSGVYDSKEATEGENGAGTGEGDADLPRPPARSSVKIQVYWARRDILNRLILGIGSIDRKGLLGTESGMKIIFSA
eukprot:1369833-Amorphochlora_amoeboformis.AAC.1